MLDLSYTMIALAPFHFREEGAWGALAQERGYEN